MDVVHPAARRALRFGAAFLIPCALALTVLLSTYESPPPPRINVRWSEAVSPSQRDALEAAHRLTQPEFRGGRTWSYAILDASGENLRRLVQDPSVEDTHGVDRSALRLTEPVPTREAVFLKQLGVAALIGLAVASLFTLVPRERRASATASVPSRSSAPATPAPWPVHVLLIAAYPVIQLFGHNVAAVPPGHAVLPLLAAVAAGVLVWTLAWLVFRSLARAAIVASIVTPVLMFFGPLHDVAAGIGPVLARGDVFTGLVAVLCLALLAVVRRLESSAVDASTRVLNVFAVTIVCVALFPAVRFHAWGGRAAGDGPVAIPSRFDVASWSCRVGYCPDIYYLVLDGYGRADALEAAYGIDNEPFLDALRHAGFRVARRSTSNYANTVPSLQSALNMDYEHAPQDGIASFRIDASLAPLLLRHLGYEYVLVPSGLPFTSSSPLADVTVDIGATQSEFTALALERSVLGAVIQSDRERNNQLLSKGVAESLDGALQWHRHITASFRAIGDLEAGRRPKFVFAHIVSPHPPYVFDENGALPSDSQMRELADLEGDNIWDSPKFAGQLAHVNRLVLDLVNRLKAAARHPPVIIIHGDHGTYRFRDTGSRDHPSARVVAERMGILFAVHAPPAIVDQFHDRITPVNAFRALFRGLFGARLELLEDRNYWSYVDPPLDVSEAVQGYVFGKE